MWFFSSYDRELWPVTLTFEHDLYRSNWNTVPVPCWRVISFDSYFPDRRTKQTDWHSEPISLPGPLKWTVDIKLRCFWTPTLRAMRCGGGGDATRRDGEAVLLRTYCSADVMNAREENKCGASLFIERISRRRSRVFAGQVTDVHRTRYGIAQALNAVILTLKLMRWCVDRPMRCQPGT